LTRRGAELIPACQLLSFCGGVCAIREGRTEQMAGMTSKLTRSLVGVATGAGVVGVILALAGVHSPVRTALVIVFLAIAPAAAVAGLLRSFDPFARIILSVVTTLVVLSIVAMILLSSGLWSPIGELIGVAAITLVCLAAQRPPVRARAAAWGGPRWRALLRRIPGIPSVLAEPGVADTPAGETAATEPRTAETAPAEAGAGAVAGNGQAEPDGAEPDETEGAEAAQAAGPTEATTPLPAVRD
jgi:hypothetical protein